LTLMKSLQTLSQIAVLLLLPRTLPAQAVSDSGGFVVRHGRDTVATERFTRTATKLDGVLNLRRGTGTSERYSAVVGPDATLPMIEVTLQEGADSGSEPRRVIQRARVIFKEDSAAVDEMGRAGLVTRILGTEKGAVPYLNLSFALLEQAIRRSRAVDSGASVSFFNLGGGQTVTAKISPLGADSLRLDIGDTRFDLRVDGQGRLVGARIPDQDVTVERR
jgi:hypothetical protein